MPEPKKLFLLDAMALIYRAFYALNKNPRINSKGMNTSAVLGFANTLLDVIKNEKPTHLGVAFDTQAPTTRAEEYIEYKANRQAMPEDLANSLPYIVKLIEGFNIPVLFVDGYEADDIIGTLVKKAEDKGFTSFMMTSDKDFGQLVSENTFIFRPAYMGNKAETLGVKEVCERFEIEKPEQVTDILGLWGDASDNIPGIPGIGEKTAKKLIATYGSLENVIAHVDDFKGKMAQNIREFAQQGIDSKRWATIILDVPIDLDEEALKLKLPDFDGLKVLFEELEFKTYAKRVFDFYGSAEATTKPADNKLQKELFDATEFETPLNIKTIENTAHNYYLLNTSEKISSLITKIKSEKSFCFDTETTGTDANSSELVGVSFSINPTEAFYLPVFENYQKAFEQIRLFKEIFEDETIEKIGQNLKYDISILKWYEIDVKGKMFDTMLAHYLIEPDQRHNLDFMAEKYLNYRPISYKELIDKKEGKELTLREIQKVRPDDVLNYAAEDADITLQLRYKLEPLLDDLGMKTLFNDIEMPLIPVLASMEAEGVKLDVEVLKKFSKQLESEIKEIENEIYALSGEEFNIGSPKQLGIVLFEKLKIDSKPKKTKTNQYSTSEDILTKLEHKHPIVSKILDFRSLAKLKSTYVDALPELISMRDGRLHTSYNQAVTSTGRLSSTNPNLQNIPIRTEKGREIRKAFVPRNDDFVLLAADYSQIELRIIAELSRDKEMMKAFIQGLDIHTATAARVYNVDIEKVTKEMRRNAKTVNFGIIYGISAFGLAERLNISRAEASEIIETYFKQYPGIKQYMNDSIAFARKNGYVETMMGRRRYLNDINSANTNIRGFAERNAINTPIQGSSADMIKIAMIRIYQQIEKRQMKSRMILQVHDELVFDAHKAEIDELKAIVEENMKNAFEMSVPILVDISTGNNWLEAY